MSAHPGCRVVHVDLSQPAATWTIAADGRHALVVFWWRSIPLGEARLDANELPLDSAATGERAAAAVAPAVGYWLLRDGFESAAADIPLEAEGDRRVAGLPQLAAFGSPLGQVDAATRDGGTRSSLRVIVCTRDRPESLAACLDGLAASREPPNEIVVVDNAPSSQATRLLVEARAGVHYVLEPRAGLSRARNAGLRGCNTELVAYTDDDVCVHPDWTGRVQDAFRDPDLAALTGLVLPVSLDTDAEWHFESKFGGFSQGYRPFTVDSGFVAATRARGVPVWRLGAGANMAFRRSRLVAIGGFDERLGAGAAGCSEDSELWYRLLEHGDRLVYDPRAVVYHAHRADMVSLRRQMWLYMRGHVAALLVQFERSGHWGNLRRLGLILPRYYASRVLGRLTSVAPLTPSTVAEEVGGAIAGVAYYLRHRGDARAASLTVTTGDPS